MDSEPRTRVALPFLSKPTIHAGRYPYMDSLRAVAALSVFMSHFNGWVALPNGLEFLQPLMIRLGNGVIVFFVISGFLIYRPFVRANLLGSRHPALDSYAKRRFLRIVPAYVVALTVTAALVGKSDVFGENGILYYGFAQIYDPRLTSGGLSVAWSLCVEAALYLFLPIWALLVAQVPASSAKDRSRRELVMLVGLLAAGLGSRYLFVGSAGRSNTISLLGYLDVFAMGMLLAYWSVIFESRPLPRSLSWLNDFPGACWALALGCFAVLAWGTGSNTSAFEAATSGQLWSRHYLAAAIGVLLVVPLVFGDQSKGRLRRTLGYPPLLWMGVVSYGIYLFHPVVLHLLSGRGLQAPGSVDLAGYLGLIGLELVLVLIVAAVSWHFIERPMIALKSVPLLSPSRPSVPAGARLVLTLSGLVLLLSGVVGTGYRFIDIVFIAAGAALVAAMMIPEGNPRPSASALLVVGITATLFALVPLALGISTADSNSVGGRPTVKNTFVAATASGGKLRIYVDGRLSAEAPAPKDAGSSDGRLELGAAPLARGWDGALDEVSIYNRAISGNDLQTLRDAGGSAAGPGLGSAQEAISGLISSYPLGDLKRGLRDSVTGRGGFVIGQVEHAPTPVAAGGSDSGALQFRGFGKVIAAPVQGLDPRNMTVTAWARPGVSVSNRAIAAVPGSWTLTTDLGGRWAFSVRGGGKSVGTVTAKEIAVRAAPRPSFGQTAVPRGGGVPPAALAAGLVVIVTTVFMSGLASGWRRPTATGGAVHRTVTTERDPNG